MTPTAKILLIGPLPPPVGGVTVSFNQLVEDLAKRGDIGTAVININPPASNLLAKLLRHLFCVGQMLWLVPQVDVVSLHATAKSAFIHGPLVWLLCKLFRKKSILRKFGGNFDQKYQQLGQLQRRIVRYTVLDMDLLLFQSKHLVDYFRSLTAKPVAWYANSRPLPESGVPPRNVTATGVTKFVFVGHVKATKGIRELADASAQLKGEMDLVVDIYGPLRDGFDAAELADTGVEYKGTLPPQAVIPTLQKYDVLLLPTYHPGEGYPGVILEGYAAGLPVIATKWNAIPEIVDHESGILIEPKSAAALKEAMLRLAQNPVEYARLRRGVSEKAHAFSSAVWSDKFVEYALALLHEERLPQSRNDTRGTKNSD